MASFGDTPGSAVLGVTSDDPVSRARAFTRLVRTYWKPCYAYLRVRWQLSASDAQDLTQGFFEHCFEKRSFAAYERSMARFRTYIKRCLDHFAINDFQRKNAQKRGGGIAVIALDTADLEQRLVASPPADADTCFDTEWRRALLERTLDQLRDAMRARKRDEALAVFERYYELDGWQGEPSYGAIESAFGLTKPTIANYLNAARKEYRTLLLENLREVTLDDDEFELELGALKS